MKKSASERALSVAISSTSVSSPAAAAARALKEGGSKRNSHEWAYILGQFDLALAPIRAAAKETR